MKATCTDFYALFCDDWKYRWREKNAKRDPMLCGVFSTRKEAEKCMRDIQGCVLTHYIRKCKVTVQYE